MEMASGLWSCGATGNPPQNSFNLEALTWLGRVIEVGQKRKPTFVSEPDRGIDDEGRFLLAWPGHGLIAAATVAPMLRAPT